MKKLNLIYPTLLRNLLLKALVARLICFNRLLGDPLERCLILDESEDYACFLEAQPYIQPQKANIEELRPENIFITMEKKVPQVELKLLPPLLKYEFLGSNSTYPMIINANLSKIEIKKLLQELRLYQKAIGYTIDDIKCINPSICMHRILLEKNNKHHRQNLKDD